MARSAEALNARCRSALLPLCCGERIERLPRVTAIKVRTGEARDPLAGRGVEAVALSHHLHLELVRLIGRVGVRPFELVAAVALDPADASVSATWQGSVAWHNGERCHESILTCLGA